MCERFDTYNDAKTSPKNPSINLFFYSPYFGGFQRLEGGYDVDTNIHHLESLHSICPFVTELVGKGRARAP